MGGIIFKNMNKTFALKSTDPHYISYNVTIRSESLRSGLGHRRQKVVLDLL